MIVHFFAHILKRYVSLEWDFIYLLSYLHIQAGNVVWEILALLYETAFLVFISIQTSTSLLSIEVFKQQYVITYVNQSQVTHLLLMYDYR